MFQNPALAEGIERPSSSFLVLNANAFFSHFLFWTKSLQSRLVELGLSSRFRAAQFLCAPASKRTMHLHLWPQHRVSTVTREAFVPHNFFPPTPPPPPGQGPWRLFSSLPFGNSIGNSALDETSIFEVTVPRSGFSTVVSLRAPLTIFFETAPTADLKPVGLIQLSRESPPLPFSFSSFFPCVPADDLIFAGGPTSSLERTSSTLPPFRFESAP